MHDAFESRAVDARVDESGSEGIGLSDDDVVDGVHPCHRAMSSDVLVVDVNAHLSEPPGDSVRAAASQPGHQQREDRCFGSVADREVLPGVQE